MTTPFRVGFVTGATPDKWAETWRRRSRVPLELVPVEEPEQEQGLRDGTLDMALVRLPVDRDVLHCIPLYEEVPVVVVGHEHVVTAVDEVELADLAEEQLVRPHVSGWRPEAPQLAWPAMSLPEAVETVAAGTGCCWRRCRSRGCCAARTRRTGPWSTCRPPVSGWPGGSTATTSGSRPSSASCGAARSAALAADGPGRTTGPGRTVGRPASADRTSPVGHRPQG